MNTGGRIRLLQSGPMAFFFALFAPLSGFFRHGLSSLFLLSIFAAGAIPYGAEASELCWYISEDGLGLRDSNDTIRKYGVFNDPISAVDAVTPQAIEQLKAELARLIQIGGFPCKLNGGTSDTQSSNFPPYYFREILVDPIPAPNSYGFCSRYGVSAQSVPRSSRWHAAVGIPPDVRDILIANCSSDDMHTIKLSNDTNPPASGDLAEVEPGKVTTTLRARVYDNNNQPVPNVNVKLEVTVEANSGGHQHNDSRPKGTVSPAEGSTGPAGSGLAFTFTAPTPAGDHKITASCIDRTCKREGPDKVWVGIRGLEPIIPASDPASGPLYVLIGQDTYHPSNHYLKPAAIGRLQQLASLYRARFLNSPLHLNDASLIRGGLFDIYYDYVDSNGGRHERNADGWWTPPHTTHRKGTDIDIRANHLPGAIPPTNFLVFEDLIKRIGAGRNPSAPNTPAYRGTPNQHYHICLMGGTC